MKNVIISLVAIFLIIGCSSNDDFAKEQFDPSYQLYSQILKTYVKSEKVDYLKLNENRADLDHFINQLAGTTKKELKNMSHNQQLAYWINAYNGITLRSIIDNYPLKSIQDIDGVWNKKVWHVAGQKVTLDYIEHKILRPTFKDARIHFAVNCASIGCPPLYNHPFLGENIDSLLNFVSSQFVQNHSRHAIDFENRTIMTTEIFSWFWEDFVNTYNTIKFQNSADVESAILNFTYSHLDDLLKLKFSKDKLWTISFASYDWSLNDIER